MTRSQTAVWTFLKNRRFAMDMTADAPLLPRSSRALVADFLRGHPGETWCSACTAERLRVDGPHAADVFFLVEGYRHFHKADEVCRGCGVRRPGLRYDAPAPGVAVAGVLCAVCGDGIKTAGDLVLIEDTAMHRVCALATLEG